MRLPGGRGAASASGSPYLVEVFGSRPHLLPGLVQELDADAEEFLEGSVVGEEHGVEVVAGLTGWKREKGEEGNDGTATWGCSKER